MTGSLNIGIIGYGNVGSHLASRLAVVGYTPRVILTSNPSKIDSKLSSQIVSEISSIEQPLDIVFTTVTDDQIATVFKALEGKASILVHCSGSTPLIEVNVPSGVMYPLQTFTAGFKVNWDHIPFFIEATDNSTLKQLSSIAEKLGGSVIESTTDQRKRIHLAGVIGNNFTNHLLQLAGSILEEAGQGLDVIKPLIEETLKKAYNIGPTEAQTGPAKRGDIQLMECQLQMIDANPELKKLYLDLVSSIQASQK